MPLPAAADVPIYAVLHDYPYYFQYSHEALGYGEAPMVGFKLEASLVALGSTGYTLSSPMQPSELKNQNQNRRPLRRLSSYSLPVA